MKLKLELAIITMLVYSICNCQNVLVFLFGHTEGNLLELQCKTLSKFLQNDHEIFVFNDAAHSDQRLLINNLCKDLNIKNVDIPDEIYELPYLPKLDSFKNSNESLWDHELRLSHSSIKSIKRIQFALDKFGFNHNGPILILDSKLFLIRSINLNDLLAKYDLLLTHQKSIGSNNRLAEFTPMNLMIINAPAIRENLDLLTIDKYLKNNPCIRKLFVNKNSFISICNNLYLTSYPTNKENPAMYPVYSAGLSNAGFYPIEKNYIMIEGGNIEFIMDNNFVHYLGSEQNHAHNFEFLKKFLENILNNT